MTTVSTQRPVSLMGAMLGALTLPWLCYVSDVPVIWWEQNPARFVLLVALSSGLMLWYSQIWRWICSKMR